MIGKTIAHYNIVGKLGQGGMGEVYLAEDTHLDRQVALKFLPAHYASDPGALARFEREAKSAAALQHPHIITVFEVGQHGGRPFIAMEYIDGDRLSDLIERKDLSIEHAVEIAVQVCDGLDEAHRAGIIHRDIKPDNILLDKAGRVKLTDFGLATSTGMTRITQEGFTVGTLQYMSPEQTGGAVLDARSDLFSFGAILYEMVTGQLAFRGESAAAIVSAVSSQTPQPLSRFNNQAPPELERIVFKALSKDRATRYQSAADMLADLRQLRATLAGSSTPYSSSGVLAKLKSRARLPVIAVAVVAVVVIGIFVWRTGRDQPVEPTPVAPTSPAQADKPSVAVLPLDNLSRDPDEEYFADGMTEMLITSLAQIGGLRVTSRTSVMQYKGTTKSIPEIASELGVTTIVEGSVMRVGDQVRVTAQLIDAVSDEHLWAQNYDRDMKDVLSLQSEVARAVANAVAVRLSPEESVRLAASSAVDPRALDEYLKGRFLWSRRTEEAVREALAHFRAAVDLAPDFALGHAGMADAHIVAAGYNWMEPRQAAPIALEAAEKALALDPMAGEPHASRGDLAYHVEHDFALAARELDRALALSPSYATAYYWRAEVSIVDGRTEEAIQLLRRAIELDPLNPFPNFLLAFAQGLAGRLDEAERGYRRVLEFSPGYSMAWGALVRLDITRGKTTEALATAHRAVEENPSASNLATLGVALGLAGKTNEARSILARLRDLGRQRWVSPYEFARVEAALGDRAAALADLRAAIEARDFWMPELKVHVDIEFQNFVGDPEFEKLIDGIGS